MITQKARPKTYKNMCFRLGRSKKNLGRVGVLHVMLIDW